MTFVSPQIPIRETTGRILGRNLDHRLWVIVNNDLKPPHKTLSPRIAAIGAAAVSSLIRGSSVGDAYRLYAIAERDDIAYHINWILPNVDCPAPKEDFDPIFMACLFETGRAMAVDGVLWRDAPPFFAHPGSPGGR
ncbi:MAG: hypothetical protein ACFCUS_13820 [Rubrimonas sp.]|uniref:hypothetical protein n=1 Tax=Rubrimonas sp. TaxID=2036015 RepID=UPI002FDEB748